MQSCLGVGLSCTLVLWPCIEALQGQSKTDYWAGKMKKKACKMVKQIAKLSSLRGGASASSTQGEHSNSRASGSSEKHTQRAAQSPFPESIAKGSSVRRSPLEKYIGSSRVLCRQSQVYRP